nr:immunoglobulin light chain junction region [Macaca mulatta]MOX29177.1 immunoglobulin light chain junction region [Macaca mulatta]MOX31321.1 immunoglobulin light chain junction region [Macaca mulatta]MOX32603.1 immunoglobulin light chain junction region [Macaca mulatta]MOX32770.1 immunoglobulin light chain junction region [Macaca mulatta]
DYYCCTYAGGGTFIF